MEIVNNIIYVKKSNMMSKMEELGVVSGQMFGSTLCFYKDGKVYCNSKRVTSAIIQEDRIASINKLKIVTRKLSELGGVIC